MRFCLFTPTFLPRLGGAERMADVIVRGLIARGHEGMVLAARPDGAERATWTPTDDQRLPYPVRRYRRPPAQHLWPEKLAWDVRRAYRAWPFEVMLAFYSYPTGYAAGCVHQRLGFRLVLNPRGGDLYRHFNALRKPRVRNVIRIGYQRADRIISISDWLTQRLHEICGDALPPIDQAPNGIDLPAHDRALQEARQFDPQDPALRELAGRPFVLHLARIGSAKRHDLAIEGLARARHAFAERGMLYVIAGDGNRAEGVRAQASQLGLDPIVRFIGPRRGVEKMWLLAHARCMVTTSREEGMPNSVLEAMASGLPILASDIGPHRELIEGRGWGVLFESGSVDDLAAKLPAMLNGDLTSMCGAALALRDSYSLTRMLDGYERVLVEEAERARAQGLCG